MRVLFCLSYLLIASSYLALGQGKDDLNEHHSLPRHEIAMSNNLVFLRMDQEISYGIHLHYLRNIGETKFGSGLGYERILDEHGHNTISVSGSYRPLHELILLISPGITFDDHRVKQINFSIHIEAGYEFEINHLHLGPVAGIAFIPRDYHISLGLHIGYIF